MREMHQCDGSTFRGLRRCVRADVDRAISYASAYSGDHVTTLRRFSFALTPPVMCVMLHRFAHLVHARGHRRIAGAIARVNQLVHRADISPASCVGPGLYVPHTSGIVFHASSGPNLTLYYRACALPAITSSSGDTPPERHGTAERLTPRLGRGVTLGVFSVVYGSVVLSDNVFVGATMAVVGNLEPDANVFPLIVRRGHIALRAARA